MDLMGLKSKILQELLEDLEDGQGEGIKPKASISVTAVKPEMEEKADDEMPLEAKDDDDLSDEDLRDLIEMYASN